MLRLFGEVREVWEEWHVIPERLLDAGDRVVVIETVRARGRGGGVELDDQAAAVWTLRHGRVTSVRTGVEIDCCREAPARSVQRVSRETEPLSSRVGPARRSTQSSAGGGRLSRSGCNSEFETLFIADRCEVAARLLRARSERALSFARNAWSERFSIARSDAWETIAFAWAKQA